ncbi:MAG: hypothetical protein P4M09_10605 [Devosia sp.]|nr:hypothetical protein [Devosia sp.]
MLYSTPLEGTWLFALDPQKHGTTQRWFEADLNDTIQLPGSVDEAQKTPLTTTRTMAHLSRRHPYVGQAWYRRTFEVSAAADGLYHALHLERAHGEVNIWIDGLKRGRDESLSTANRFFLGPLQAGTHTLAMMIDNDRFEAVGDAIVYQKMPDVAHSKTDHTQTNWNGVIGEMRIEAFRAAITRVDVFALTRSVRVHVELDAFDPELRHPTYWTTAGNHKLTLRFALAGIADPLVIERQIEVNSAFVPVDLEIELPEQAALWDEFAPVVHRLEVEWARDGVLQDKKATSFGIRTFVADGKRLKLNGRPVFLRGTLECALFPLTGYPPTGHAGWRKVFETIQSYGLNHVRFHSNCPPKAAFEVADEMGLLLHIETPVWAVLGADPNLDRYIYSETARILRDYGNHPSFVMFAVGNELHGSAVHSFLERWVDHWKPQDPRRAFTGGSAWPTTSRADYASKPEPRNQMWLENLNGRLNRKPLDTRTDFADWQARVPMPLVSHETGQWCAYPNLAEIEKYTGVLAARNFEMVRDDLESKGRLGLAHDFLMASGKLQTQLYKEEMEAALRTRDLAGTQLLGLQDFSGQGTALVGVVDAFWEEKPYVTAEQFREFCSPIVPLLRADGFVATEGEGFVADLQLAQFGPSDLADVTARWDLLSPESASVRSGTVRASGLRTGHLHDLGTIAFDTTGLGQGRYEIVVGLAGTPYRNRWGFWVFEKAGATPELRIVRALDDAVLGQIAAGETVILAPEPASLKPNAVLGHTAVFWNTLWTSGQEPHTLGLLNDTAHPVFGAFPADFHSDWHLWDLTFHRRPFDIAGVPFTPIIRIVDDWNENRDLALVAEIAIGEGRLIICASDIEAGLETRPVARAFRSALKSYVDGQPTTVRSGTAGELMQWWQRVSA